MTATRRLIVWAATAILLLSLGTAASASAPELPAGRSAQAPVLGVDSPDAIPNRYLVVFDKGTAQSAQRAAIQQARAAGASVHFVYSHAIQGFAATLPARALEGITRNPNVAFVEADMTVSIAATQSPATWGIDRVDQRDLPLDNSYTYNFDGSGVDAYIIDTGIRRTHNEFGGRALHGYTAISDGRGSDDCHGHGTHVAGTVGGSTYGLAKNVTLYAVRVLDCNGSGSIGGVVAGVDWVTNNHSGDSVANMSLGGSANSTLDNAVANSISSGVTYAIAAGNSNANACNYSPARVSTALTAGASTSSDVRSSFSNYGSCVDLFAPGSSITSAWNSSDTATNTISGTSMASPHIAGGAVLYLDENPGASPATVHSAVTNAATSGRLSSIGSGSPNLLLYTLFDGGEPPPPPPPPPPGDCDLSEDYTGSLAGTGDFDYHPNGTYFFSGSGTHNGCLDGPDGTDFDLYLYKWNGLWWSVVAYGISPDSHEEVTYNGTSGFYLWEVYSFSGAGSYAFSMDRP